MAQVTLSSKNQIVIPREAREALGVKVGDQLLVVVCGVRVMVLKKLKSISQSDSRTRRGHLFRRLPCQGAQELGLTLLLAP